MAGNYVPQREDSHRVGDVAMNMAIMVLMVTMMLLLRIMTKKMIIIVVVATRRRRCGLLTSSRHS